MHKKAAGRSDSSCRLECGSSEADVAPVGGTLGLVTPVFELAANLSYTPAAASAGCLVTDILHPPLSPPPRV
jgi:hypothetical protein